MAANENKETHVQGDMLFPGPSVKSVDKPVKKLVVPPEPAPEPAPEGAAGGADGNAKYEKMARRKPLKGR